METGGGPYRASPPRSSMDELLDRATDIEILSIDSDFIMGTPLSPSGIIHLDEDRNDQNLEGKLYTELAKKISYNTSIQLYKGGPRFF